MKPRFAIRKPAVYVCFLFLLTNASAQISMMKPVAKSVFQMKEAHVEFTLKQLFNPLNDPGKTAVAKSFVSDPTILKLDLPEIAAIYSSRENAIELSIPYKNETSINVELIKVNLFAEGFIVETNNGGSPFNYSPGVYYQGIIKGDPTSLVAISIFEDGLMGVISNAKEGNINIGQLKSGAIDDYLIYSDKDVLVVPVSAGCGTTDDYQLSDAYMGDRIESGSSRTVNVVNVYLESDYQLYQNKGSVTNTTNYLTGIFNNSQIIYTNDGITMALSEIFVWTSSDPYSAASSFDALDDFMNFRTTFNGDVAQLCALDPGGLGGVAATVDGLCNDYRYCYSDIDATYNDFPTYSWTIMVFTHELGHIFGSNHTHWCGWPGGAIDNCGPIAGYGTEGGCAAGPPPVDGGTIMSYCHLTVYGINLANGFGPYPKDAIIDNIESAGCLDGGGGGTYCISEGNNSTHEWIDRVKVQLMDRISGNDGGYYDATAMSQNIKQGNSKAIKLSAGMTTVHTQYWRVWVDWNHDFDFDDAGELEVSITSSSAGALAGTISVPATATVGMTRMRVSMKYNAAPTPCESFGFGEVEDYTINVIAALPGELIADVPELLIYPNPAINEVNLQWNNLNEGELSINLTDISGKLIQQKQINSSDGQVILNLGDLPAGIYFVKAVSTNGDVFSGELVKE